MQRSAKSLLLAWLGLLATAQLCAGRAPPSRQPQTAAADIPVRRKPRHRCHRRLSRKATPINSTRTRTTPRGRSSGPNSGRFGPCATWRRRISPIPPLIDKVIQDGKMYLSMDDAVALALENNLDIAIQRYNLITADTDILRTSSGSAALGVNTGLVQGTPGGTPGSTAPVEPAPRVRARPEAELAARALALAERLRAQLALLPRPKAKARRSTISIQSLPAPVRNNTQSRQPPTFSLAPRR